MYEDTIIATNSPTVRVPGKIVYITEPVVSPAANKMVAMRELTCFDEPVACSLFLSAPKEARMSWSTAIGYLTGWKSAVW